MEGQVAMEAPPKSSHVCPWWIGWLMLCPLRKLLEPPERILGPHVRPGMTVLEPGCAMGFFSLPLARLVGPAGKVVCVDLQERMIRALRRRARKAGLAERIDTVVCAPDDLRIDPWRGRVDLVAAIHMVHEVPDPPALLAQLFTVLRPGGRLLLLEPKAHGHVSPAAFEITIEHATAAGFELLERPAVRRSHAALLGRPAAGGAS